MAVQIISVCLLAAAGIQLGTLWIMRTSILPLLDALPYDRYVRTCQLIDMHVFHPIALWTGIISAATGVTMAVVGPTPLTATFFAVGAAGMLAVGITSEGVNRPIWRQIEKWSPRRTALGWLAKRRTWHLAHVTRTYGGAMAVLGFTAAAAAVAVS
jgi:hypothetical protein